MSENGNVREDIKTQMDSINEISKQLEIAIKIMKHSPLAYNKLGKSEINAILRMLITNNIDNLHYINWADSKEGYSYWFTLLNTLIAKDVSVSRDVR